jgi:hypothetical protein
MKDKEYYFPLYRDEDIGVNMFWQSHIIESTVDEDVDTDDDQLKVAKLHTFIELREALEILRDKGWKILRNKPCCRPR